MKNYRRKNRQFVPTPRFYKMLALLGGIAAALILLYAVLPSAGQTKPMQLAKTEPEQNIIDGLAEVDISGKTVIVDAGHGGDDVGCIGAKSGRYEKEVNLEIAKRLQALLSQNGAFVIMTRTDDDMIAEDKEADMQERERIIRESGADLFISIHQNEFENETAAGPQVFYVEQGSEGKKLATAIQQTMNIELDIPEDTARMALPVAYRLLKVGAQPSCTVECGFFSNPEEEALLQTAAYQNRVAQAILDGVRLYVRQYG